MYGDVKVEQDESGKLVVRYICPFVPLSPPPLVPLSSCPSVYLLPLV
jgi:hypothetical protein